jgi:hypothetical protein
MEHVHLAIVCCRHAFVLIRGEWSRRAEGNGAFAWPDTLRARWRSKVRA